MDAAELVADVRRRYAGARRYEDRGTVQLQDRRAAQVAFETSFERGRLLAFSADVHRSGVNVGDREGRSAFGFRWEDGALTFRSSFDVPGIAVDTVELAVAALLGITYLASSTVPLLLLPEMFNEVRGLFDFDRGLRIGTSVVIDDAPHHLIELPKGGLEDAPLVRVSVNPSSLVIRRIEMLPAEEALTGGRSVRTDYEACLS